MYVGVRHENGRMYSEWPVDWPLSQNGPLTYGGSCRSVVDPDDASDPVEAPGHCGSPEPSSFFSLAPSPCSFFFWLARFLPLRCVSFALLLCVAEKDVRFHQRIPDLCHPFRKLFQVHSVSLLVDRLVRKLIL